MIDQIFNLVRRRAHFLGTCLIALIFANFLVQLYTHKTTALTAWKGGGFGMYTEPHVLNRSVWLAMDFPNETRHVLLFPPSDAAETFVEPESAKAFDSLRSYAWEFRVFPTDHKARKFVKRFDEITWLPEFDTGDASLRVVVFENRSDLQAKTLTRVPVYDSKGEGN